MFQSLNQVFLWGTAYIIISDQDAPDCHSLQMGQEKKTHVYAQIHHCLLKLSHYGDWRGSTWVLAAPFFMGSSVKRWCCTWLAPRTWTLFQEEFKGVEENRSILKFRDYCKVIAENKTIFSNYKIIWGHHLYH